MSKTELKTYPVDSPLWIFFPAADKADPITGTLEECLKCAGIETLTAFRKRLREGIRFAGIFAPDFTNKPNDLLVHKYKKLAAQTGELNLESGDRIKFKKSFPA